MKKSTQYIVSLWVSILFTASGAIFKIMHWPEVNLLFSLGLIFGLPFIYLGIADVYQNRKDTFVVRIMWMIGFIFLSAITGLVYLSQYKKGNED
ncbi:MAG: hypothetical protein OJF59_002116 [Cytophagales bacterium]|jgi:NhaP-type Na+/H+ or K+/H+ antiporter|nr:MAG: hypothetical protein OJF59_002116 [Cytophagales bacterium]